MGTARNRSFAERMELIRKGAPGTMRQQVSPGLFFRAGPSRRSSDIRELALGLAAGSIAMVLGRVGFGVFEAFADGAPWALSWFVLLLGGAGLGAMLAVVAMVALRPNSSAMRLALATGALLVALYDGPVPGWSDASSPSEAGVPAG